MTAVEFLEEKLDNFLELHHSEWILLQKFIDKAKEMEKEQIANTSLVKRVEVIQHSPPYNGRAYTNYNAKDVEIQLQDDEKTLKIFLK